jgi:hypothetical protein
MYADVHRRAAASLPRRARRRERRERRFAYPPSRSDPAPRTDIRAVSSKHDARTRAGGRVTDDEKGLAQRDPAVGLAR